MSPLPIMQRPITALVMPRQTLQSLEGRIKTRQEFLPWIFLPAQKAQKAQRSVYTSPTPALRFDS